MTSPNTAFLPTTRTEMCHRGWDQLDILLITGDAYVDHPTHGVAVIGRVLENAGYRVGILSRPDYRTPASFEIMGRPGLFVGISAGAVDSTLNNYTADLAPRTTDRYIPADETIHRPNFATAVYTAAAKSVFPNLPVILGGLEASTRRFAYFDYLKKNLRRSALVDTRATLLVFGPGEQQILEIANRLQNGKPLAGIPGTAELKRDPAPSTYIPLPAYATLQQNPTALLQQATLLETHMGPHAEFGFSQLYSEGTVVCHPPAIVSSEFLDHIYELPFTREAHPSVSSPVPALETVRWSITSHRGCPGGCSFCAISFHQGRRVVNRSTASVLSEIRRITRLSRFAGTITDVGGPTANSFGCDYKSPQRCRACRRPSCLYPHICPNLNDGQRQFMTLLGEARRIHGIRHVFVASGIRHDLALRYPAFIAEIAAYHTGGHLKVAPEHIDRNVLKLMRKPEIETMERFERLFQNASQHHDRKQYLVPYFIAGFPGCSPEAADRVGKWLRQRNQTLQQVQNFIPLPGTLAAAMYATGSDPQGNPLFVADAAERRRQKQLLTAQKRPQRHPFERRKILQ